MDVYSSSVSHCVLHGVYIDLCCYWSSLLEFGVFYVRHWLKRKQEILALFFEIVCPSIGNKLLFLRDKEAVEFICRIISAESKSMILSCLAQCLQCSSFDKLSPPYIILPRAAARIIMLLFFMLYCQYFALCLTNEWCGRLFILNTTVKLWNHCNNYHHMTEKFIAEFEVYFCLFDCS